MNIIMGTSMSVSLSILTECTVILLMRNRKINTFKRDLEKLIKGVPLSGAYLYLLPIQIQI